MEIKELNQILSNLGAMINDHGANPYKKVLDTREGTCEAQESQGDHDTITRVFDLNRDSLFLKIVLHTDSYGDNEFLHKIEFVKPVIKEVTDFQTI